jgi:hypothetical protein
MTWLAAGLLLITAALGKKISLHESILTQTEDFVLGKTSNFSNRNVSLTVESITIPKDLLKDDLTEAVLLNANYLHLAVVAGKMSAFPDATAFVPIRSDAFCRSSRGTG